MKLLIENGAEINIKDNDGNTPLHYAAKRGFMGIIRLLVENGADINAKNNDGQTPNDISFFKGNVFGYLIYCLKPIQNEHFF